MIYTSYFAKYKGDKGVNISRYNKFWSGASYPTLAPDAELLTLYKMGRVSIEEYTNIYNQQLRKLDVHKVYADLNGKVLLCYEKNGDFCHRHLIADWFKKYGYECEEL